ncbi:MAG: hypothetical protein R6W31_11680 [Bacteroidales bacterium]
MNRKKRYWIICMILVVVLIVTAYTPLMIPHGVYKPMILGIPYSLWTSFLITVALVVITYIGGKVHPGSDEEEGES